MKSDGSDLKQHTHLRTVCTFGSFSSDLRQIVYRKVIDGPAFQWDLSAVGRNSEVFVANADGSGEVNVSKSPAFDGWPLWSPDGKLIVFSVEPGRSGERRPDLRRETGRLGVAPNHERPGRLRAAFVVTGWPADRRLSELGDGGLRIRDHRGHPVPVKRCAF